MLPEKLQALVALAVLAALTVLPAAAEMTAGKADLKSAGALEFGPGNVLFVGDSEGATVYALEVTPPARLGHWQDRDHRRPRRKDRRSPRHLAARRLHQGPGGPRGDRHRLSLDHA